MNASTGSPRACNQPDDAEHAGWTRRFTASEPRLSEMADLYRSLGLEVRLGEATPEPGQDCLACGDDPSVRTIYTRPLTGKTPAPSQP